MWGLLVVQEATLLRGNSTDTRLLVDEIRPPLEHADPMFQVDSSVIGTVNLIMIGVGQLCFNPVRLELTSFI